MSGALVASSGIGDPFTLGGINWGNILTGPPHQSANGQQKCNAQQTVTILVTHSLGNGVLFGRDDSGNPPMNTGTTYSWVPGAQFVFRAAAAASGGLVTVTNSSDGGALVNTFTVTYP